MFREGQVLSDLIQMNISSFFSLSLSMFQFFDFIVYNDDDRQKNPEEWNYLTHTGSQLQSRIEKDEKKKKWTCGKKHTENNWIKTAPTTSNKNRSYTQTKRKRKNRHEQENISIRVIVKVKLFGCVSSLLLFSYVFFSLLFFIYSFIVFHFIFSHSWIGVDELRSFASEMEKAAQTYYDIIIYKWAISIFARFSLPIQITLTINNRLILWLLKPSIERTHHYCCRKHQQIMSSNIMNQQRDLIESDIKPNSILANLQLPILISFPYLEHTVFKIHNVH